MIQRGQHPVRQVGADTNAQESLVLWLDRLNQQGMAGCLVGLAGIAEAQQDEARAVQLLAVADVLHHNCGMALEAADQAAYHQRMADLRARLDDERFAQAWTAGRGLSIEQAIADALDTPLC